MSIATVMYRNPFEEWFWESGAVIWVLAITVIAAIIVYAPIIWRNRK